MIKNVLITGDTHGRVVERVQNIARDYPNYKPNETAIIILGDAGINFYLNKSDKKNKYRINNLGYTIYCVRGNHEEHPGNIRLILLGSIGDKAHGIRKIIHGHSRHDRPEVDQL